MSYHATWSSASRPDPTHRAVRRHGALSTNSTNGRPCAELSMNSGLAAAVVTRPFLET